MIDKSQTKVIHRKEDKPAAIRVDELCHTLLHKTADRAGIHVRQLVDMSAAALLSSISKHLPDRPSKAGETDVDSKSPATHTVPLTRHLWENIRNYACALEVSPIDMLRDAILAQSPNFNRLQSVNARNFSSVRVRLYFIEQGCVDRDVPPGGIESHV